MKVKLIHNVPIPLITCLHGSAWQIVIGHVRKLAPPTAPKPINLQPPKLACVISVRT
jgi:hypothetical protein